MTKERPNCWIRGQMDERDYQDDPVRLATIRCPYRVAQVRTFFFGARREMDYDCSHPAAVSEHEEFQDLPGGGVMAGGVDGFATFCKPVDMHLTSLGEKSRFIIEGEWTDVSDNKLLPPGK